tara:strand:- start:270 stop:698 length:429 start_codon:yes stop_codon:yes gene_type:complete
MKKLHKKGFGESLIIIISIFIIAIFLIAFIAKYSISPAKKEKLINTNMVNVENKLLLINYLKTPYKNGIIADYIAKGSINELKSKTSEILKKEKYSAWRLKVYNTKSTEISENFNERNRYQTIKTVIPSLNQGVIEIELNLQ